MKKAAESSRQFLSVIRRWDKLEDTTLRSADVLIRKTTNPLVKTIMEVIKQDSQKHKIVLKAILSTLTEEAAHLSPDELVALSGLLMKHMEIEAASVQHAAEALGNSKLFYTNYLLSSLLEDENKHHRMISQLLDELKRASVPSSSGVRRKKGS
jgi:GH35 family endo-1,4-beta-xylanase